MSDHIRCPTAAFLMFLTTLTLCCLNAKCRRTVPPPDTAQKSGLIQPSAWWERLPRPIYSELEKIMTSQDWFEVYKLAEGTFAVYEPHQFEEAISYIVLGKDRAAVIDTGTGIGNLRRVAEELTDLPLFVVNTHTHWDHIGGNSQFDEVVCFNDPACIERLRMGVPHSKLKDSLTPESLRHALPPEFQPETWIIPPVEPTSLLEDGSFIELGDRTLEVMHTPGHSSGSICLLDAKHRLLFSGDVFFPGPLYAYEDEVDLDLYIQSIERMRKRMGDYDHLCSGHNDPWVESGILDRVAAAFQTILDGKGDFDRDGNLRRYYFQGFDILIREDMVETRHDSPA